MNHTRHRQKNCTTATDAASTDPATTFEACEKRHAPRNSADNHICQRPGKQAQSMRPPLACHRLRDWDVPLRLNCKWLTDVESQECQTNSTESLGGCSRARSHPWVRWCNIDHPRQSTCLPCGLIPWRIVRVETIRRVHVSKNVFATRFLPAERHAVPTYPTSQVLQLSHSMAKQNSLASG